MHIAISIEHIIDVINILFKVEKMISALRSRVSWSRYVRILAVAYSFQRI